MRDLLSTPISPLRQDHIDLLGDFLIALATDRPLHLLIPSRAVPGLLICAEVNALEYLTHTFQPPDYLRGLFASTHPSP